MEKKWKVARRSVMERKERVYVYIHQCRPCVGVKQLLLLLEPSPHANVVIQPLDCLPSIQPANNSFGFFLKIRSRGITCGGFQEPEVGAYFAGSSVQGNGP